MFKVNDNTYYVGVSEAGKLSDGAYLITGEKNALIETVSDGYSDLYIQNIQEILSIREIDYLIFTHTEPRCLECVEKILELNPDIEIIGTIPTVKNLKEITNRTFNERIAKNNSVLCLGEDMTLRFTIAPNLPSPDSMLVYLENYKILFSGHLFASYFSAQEPVNADFTCLEEYYKDNLLPFRPFVAGALEKIQIDTSVICPCRGSIISDRVKEYIEKYVVLTAEETDKNKTVVICYPADNGYTNKMADIISDELLSNGIRVQQADACAEDIAKKLNSADALIIGTSTIHRNARNEVLHAVADLNAVSVNGKPYFVFGSYGWSGEGTEIIHNFLKMLRMKPVSKPFTVHFNPSEKDIEELRGIVKRFACDLQNIYN
ncbi:MAG: FprA family A-type flavoprotein [Oscillospiraceae bacterium]|nr:FprA family A-type flavoprotein [Oscillospiraceae bacterium]